MSAVTDETTMVNTRTAPLMAMSDSSGIVFGGTSAMMALRPRYASGTPSRTAAHRR